MRAGKRTQKTSGKKWTLTILGCGTSTGVPLLFCDCAVCRSKNPKNHRLRTSAWLRADGKSVLIDTSTDLRQQALRARIPRLDAILFTHPHADHVSGLDEVRSFNFAQKEHIPAYGNAWTCRELRGRFPYIFKPDEKAEGGGIPRIELHEFSTDSATFDAGGLSFIPISLNHGREECVGYRWGPLAYITDCQAIPSKSMGRLQGLEVLVLDCLRLKPHPTHLNLEQSLETIAKLKPKRTILTHLGHDFDYRTWSKKLPKGTELAYDGLEISPKF